MFNIIGKFKNKTEVLDTAKDKYEAGSMVKEYKDALGPQWEVKIVPGKVERQRYSKVA